MSEAPIGNTHPTRDTEGSEVLSLIVDALESAREWDETASIIASIVRGTGRPVAECPTKRDVALPEGWDPEGASIFLKSLNDRVLDAQQRLRAQSQDPAYYHMPPY